MASLVAGIGIFQAEPKKPRHFCITINSASPDEVDTMSASSYSFEFGMESEYEDHLSRTFSELGEPEALFQISRARFLTKLIVGATLLIAGLVANYLWWIDGVGINRFDNHWVLMLLISVPIVGAGLLWHMYGHRGLMILIYPTGLLRLRRGEIDSFPWATVDHVRLKVQRVNVPEITRDSEGNLVACWLLPEVPTFQLWRAGLLVAREDGVETQFGPALTNYSWLAEEVQKRTFNTLWPQTWERFQAGEPIDFGELELSLKGVKHAGGKQLRWNEVKELSVFNGALRIKQAGKWFPTIIMDIYSVPNPHILFALVREAQG